MWAIEYVSKEVLSVDMVYCIGEHGSVGLVVVCCIREYDIVCG